MTWLTYIKNIADWIRQLTDTTKQLTIIKLYQLLKSVSMFNTITGSQLKQQHILKGKTAYANNVKVTGTKEAGSSLDTNSFEYIIRRDASWIPPQAQEAPAVDGFNCDIVPIRFINARQYQLSAIPWPLSVREGTCCTVGDILIVGSQALFLSNPEKYSLVSKYRAYFTHAEYQDLTGEYLYFPLDSRRFVLRKIGAEKYIWMDGLSALAALMDGNFLTIDYQNDAYAAGDFSDALLANKSFTSYNEQDGTVKISIQIL